MTEEKYGITIMNELEKNVLEVALDHMQEHLEELIDFHESNRLAWNYHKYHSKTINSIQLNRTIPLLEKLEACKNLKNSLK